MRRLSPRSPILAFLFAACTAPDSTMPTPAGQTPIGPTPTGAQALDGTATDVHSCARPREVRVRHVALDLQLDFDQQLARGTATLDLDRMDPRAPLWLDTQGLAIAAVHTADSSRTPLRFELLAEDPLLGRPLRIELPGGLDRVAIDYATVPGTQGAMQWLAPAQTASNAPFLFTQGQAILTRSWIPLQDSPGVRVTWNATIRAPAGLRPLMSAMQSGGNERDGYTFAMQRPVPSYLIALACGRLERREISARCAVWAEPTVVERAAKEFEDMEHMVAACETLFGAYRWGRYDLLVLPPSFPFGGMENPCLTFATPTVLAGDKSLVALVAHELAHSWSGNLVTNATWRDFWLNEGFTVFLEQRIMEHVYGKDRSDMEIELEVAELRAEVATLPPGDQVLHIDLAGRNPDDGMTNVPYQKGAGLLRRLEQVVGRPRFDAFLRGWFDGHAFQSVTTAMFEDWLQQHLLADDAQAKAAIDLQTWIHGPGLPADMPVPKARAFEVVDRAVADLLQTRDASKLPPMADWCTQQWLRLLAAMPADRALLAELDRARHFTATGNAEILKSWLELAIAADYAEAMPRLREFLLGVGRRKFLKPLYEALLKRPDGQARALAIYRDARGRYHPVAVRTLDEILHWAPQ
jgi:hypothetical protein